MRVRLARRDLRVVLSSAVARARNRRSASARRRLHRQATSRSSRSTTARRRRRCRRSSCARSAPSTSSAARCCTSRATTRARSRSSSPRTASSPFYTILKDIGQAYERELDYERAIALPRALRDERAEGRTRHRRVRDRSAGRRTNVIARINVLQNLRAKILVNTEPRRRDDHAVQRRGHRGPRPRRAKSSRCRAAATSCRSSATATSRTRRRSAPKIGKPYTIFAKLEPVERPLLVRVVPADARLFLDKRQVGTGALRDRAAGRPLHADRRGRRPAHRRRARSRCCPIDDTPCLVRAPATAAVRSPPAARVRDDRAAASPVVSSPARRRTARSDHRRRRRGHRPPASSARTSACPRTSRSARAR